MQPNILKKHASLISALVRSFDVIITAVAGYAAFVFKFSIDVNLSQQYIIAILLGCMVTIVGFNLLGFYEPTRGRSIFSIVRQVILAWLLITLILTVIAFFSKTGAHFSREWFFEWMFLGGAISLLLRLLMVIVLRIFRRVGYNTRTIVIIGSGELGQKVYRRLCKGRGTGYRVTCFLDRSGRAKQGSIDGIEVQPIPDNLGEWIVEQGIDEVWIALPLRALSVMKTLLHQLRFSTANIKVVPDIFELDLLNHSVFEVAGMPVINLRATPMEGLNILIKSIEDKILSVLILLLISPLLLAIAIGIKITSAGPVFYKQKRYGFDGRVINVYKFRSMFVHQDASVIQQASQGDPRITPLGRFLRKTSLDELPQFINVLQGRMSIVGPRPHAISHNEHYKSLVKQYMQRHMVKPGITGWAQINGFRGETDTLEKMQKRVEYDLYYIEHWSLGFDLKIIFLTIFKGFISKNAY
jgi:putative colanic acid biosynthesis UDP-glucose lipid carrier transferase